jgi:sodium/potassium-transporting ATPase subunit alpha
MNIAGLTVDQAVASLASSAAGLSSREAERRLREFGPNRLEKISRVPFLVRLGQSFTHFFAVILWFAAGMAFFAESREAGQGMAEVGFAIVGVILINGVFSFWQEYRAERALAALRGLLPRKVKALRDGMVKLINADLLVPGDIVILAAGDNVPADCRLIQAFSVRVNLATVSGESLPKARDAEGHPNAAPLAARNLVLAGTSLVSGEGRAVVYATGMATEFGRIARLSQSAPETASPLQREIRRLSRLVAALALGLGVVFFAIGHALGMPFWGNLLFAIGIIVANVPEGLLPTVTLALALATQRMARRNALVRHLPAVETLGATTVILCDKTGTLTRNHMTVKRIFAGRAFSAPDQWSVDDALAPGHPALLRTMQICHSVLPVQRQGRVEWIGDPMETALLEFAQRFADAGGGPRRVAEIPFEGDRKRMSVVCEEHGLIVLHCKGALESLLEVAVAVDDGLKLRPLDAVVRREFLYAQDRMARAGLRVLAFGYRPLARIEDARESGLALCGLVGIEDAPRPEVPAAIARCHDAGIRVIMVTGDHPVTALAVGREIGLVRGAAPKVIRGDQLGQMSATELRLVLDAPDVLFARVGAEQKMHIVQALQAKGHVVAVTGDGVNDAPALKCADIGVAMGIAGTDVAREAADMVLLDDNFATIVAAVEEGRAVFENIRKFLTYILTSNIPEVVPYLAFVLFKIPLPLTVIQILAVDLGTDMLPALALGAERPHPGLMREPPRTRGERLLSWGLLARAYLWLGIMEAGIAMAAFAHVLARAGMCYGDTLSSADPLYHQATTATLAGIVVAQIVNVFLCRHARESVSRFGLFSNKWLLLGIVVEIALIGTIVYTPWGNQLIGTAPLDPEPWIVMVVLGLVMLALEELRKWIVRLGIGAKNISHALGAKAARQT